MITKLALLAVAEVTARRIPAKTVKFIFAEKKKKKAKKIEKKPILSLNSPGCL